MTYEIIACIVLLICTIRVFRTHRIPNNFTLVIIGLFLPVYFLTGMTTGPLQHHLLWAVGIYVFVSVFRLFVRGVGSGVSNAFAIGALWTPPAMIFEYFANAIFAGGIGSLIYMVLQRRNTNNSFPHYGATCILAACIMQAPIISDYLITWWPVYQ